MPTSLFLHCRGRFLAWLNDTLQTLSVRCWTFKASWSKVWLQWHIPPGCSQCRSAALWPCSPSSVCVCVCAHHRWLGCLLPSSPVGFHLFCWLQMLCPLLDRRGSTEAAGLPSEVLAGTLLHLLPFVKLGKALVWNVDCPSKKNAGSII